MVNQRPSSNLKRAIDNDIISFFDHRTALLRRSGGASTYDEGPVEDMPPFVPVYDAQEAELRHQINAQNPLVLASQHEYSQLVFDRKALRDHLRAHRDAVHLVHGIEAEWTAAKTEETGVLSLISERSVPPVSPEDAAEIFTLQNENVLTTARLESIQVRLSATWVDVMALFEATPALRETLRASIARTEGSLAVAITVSSVLEGYQRDLVELLETKLVAIMARMQTGEGQADPSIQAELEVAQEKVTVGMQDLTITLNNKAMVIRRRIAISSWHV